MGRRPPESVTNSTDLDFGQCLVELGLTPRENGDMRAAVRELTRERESETFAPASDVTVLPGRVPPTSASGSPAIGRELCRAHFSAWVEAVLAARVWRSGEERHDEPTRDDQDGEGGKARLRESVRRDAFVVL